MGLSTYADLKASVADWLHRADLDAVIPDFIVLAEEAMGEDLADCAVMWVTTAPIALSAGQDTVSLPADALGLNWAKVLTPVEDVLHINPSAATVRATGANTSSAGRPQVVALTGNDGAAGAPEAVLWPKADQDYTLQFGYRAAVPALRDAAPVNFILKRAPSLYLYGSLIASAPYLKQDVRLAVWETKYAQALERFKGQAWTGPALLRTELGGGAGFDITTG